MRDDALLAWRWHPADGGRVTDRNNATDGDLFAAWALLRAADRFEEPRYRELAGGIAAALAETCIRPDPSLPEGLLLLPGAEGFEADGEVVINPAYYMLRAMRELSAAFENEPLQLAAADGSALLSRLARKRLVPDWVTVTPDGFAPAKGKSSAFGYEAMRVPLYLIWSGVPGHAAVMRAREAYLAAAEKTSEATPTVIDPKSGESLERSPDPGYRSLAALAACAEGSGTGGLMPAFAVGQAYYPRHAPPAFAHRST